MTISCQHVPCATITINHHRWKGGHNPQVDATTICPVCFQCLINKINAIRTECRCFVLCYVVWTYIRSKSNKILYAIVLDPTPIVTSCLLLLGRSYSDVWCPPDSVLQLMSCFSIRTDCVKPKQHKDRREQAIYRCLDLQWPLHICFIRICMAHLWSLANWLHLNLTLFASFILYTIPIFSFIPCYCWTSPFIWMISGKWFLFVHN